MKIVDQEKLDLIELPGHFNSFNKKLIGANVGAKNVEVMLGIAEAGGGSEIHYHPEAEHIIYVIEGVLRIRNEKGEEVELKKGMAAYIPPGEKHQPYNPSSSRTMYLVINSPPASMRV
ncbi:MAG: cupin domain-containing protein [Candidatus Bathyarchaeia archaeon]